MHDPVKCTVVGIGGIGTWLSTGIAAALEFGAPGSQLLLIDGDTFEERNAERQTFSTLGNKAQVLRKDIAYKYPRTVILGKAAWVVEPGKEKEETEEGIGKLAPLDFMSEGDHVFCVVDNYATRKLVFDAARELSDIDVYTGGNGEDLSGSIYHYCRRGGEDVTQHPGFAHPEFVNPPDKNPGSMSCEERAKIDGGSQILAANMSVAALLLAKVSYFVLGTDEQQLASLLMSEVQFDMAYGRALPYDWRVEQGEPEPVLPALVSASQHNE